MKNFWALLDEFPPILVRLLARHPRGAPLSTLEIAERSGLSPMKVECLSQSTDWRDVDVLTARKFLEACGVNLVNHRALKRIRVYMRGQVKNGNRVPTSYRYLKRSPDWETYYRPLRDRFAQSLMKGKV